MIWQQRKAETDGLDAYKARNIYYHSIFDDLVKINNRIIVDEPTLRRGLNGCCVPGKKRLYVTATGEYKACERIGSSPSIGNVDEGVDRELIVKSMLRNLRRSQKTSAISVGLTICAGYAMQAFAMKTGWIWG